MPSLPNDALHWLELPQHEPARATAAATPGGGAHTDGWKLRKNPLVADCAGCCDTPLRRGARAVRILALPPSRRGRAHHPRGVIE